jgi:glucosylceramidase
MRKAFYLLPVLAIISCTQQTPLQLQNTAAAGSFTTDGKTITVYSTADTAGLRLAKTATLQFGDLGKTVESQIYVFVNPSRTFQTIVGIGGALTDAAAETYAKLPEPKQEEILQAYYDPEKGIGYTLGRTNINSCDFSSDSYTYVNEGDKDLKSFDISHDMKFKIPLIKKAIAAAGGKLTLFASPWSPPAFMKDNNNMLHGGKLKPEFYQPWALYYTKFIKSFEKEGIPVWGITIQNEPMATQTWESCIYSAEDERDFIKNYLGPTMQKEGLSDRKIIVWDHNRDLMVQRAQAIFDDPEASKFAWGIGFHWYEDWSGGQQMYNNVGLVHSSYPDKNILFTEGCRGPFDTSRYYAWDHGESYGRSMINDFNNGTSGWTDWNILLDQTGGPNHVGNFCFAPVHADLKTGQLIYTNSYYYIGHFSKFVRPGAKRISCAASRSQLLTTAFINQDGKVAVIVMNQGDKRVSYNLCFGLKSAAVSIMPHSIQTLVI